MLADGAGTLTLVSIPPNPSAIENNGIDVDLKFGTRATFDGVTIRSVTGCLADRVRLSHLVNLCAMDANTGT